MDSAPKHTSQDRTFYTAPSNGSDPIKAEEKTNGPEPVHLSISELPATRRPAFGPPQPPLANALWLARLWVVIRVAFFIELGMVLVVLPWTRAWTENHLLLAQPALRQFLHNYFVRGLVSGLGFIDIGLGIWEAVRYKELRCNQSRSDRPS